jgi:hypothetical protein
LRVISAEGLIGFKLQALANDPRRTQDLEDIRALMRANRQLLNETELDPCATLDDLMCVVEALCPVWPQRPSFASSSPIVLM